MVINKKEIEGNNCYCFHNIGFDYVNENAEVVIVGITPGLTQMNNDNDESKTVKQKHAFAGTRMRNNLKAMFDGIKLREFLHIDGLPYEEGEESGMQKKKMCLWSDEFFNKVEMTSLLKEATFCNCSMFNDPKKIKNSEVLTEAFEKGFKKDCAKYTKAKMFVALGKKVKPKLEELRAEGVINAPIVGLAHPSGSNTNDIKKFKEDVSGGEIREAFIEHIAMQIKKEFDFRLEKSKDMARQAIGSMSIEQLGDINMKDFIKDVFQKMAIE